MNFEFWYGVQKDCAIIQAPSHRTGNDIIEQILKACMYARQNKAVLTATLKLL